MKNQHFIDKIIKLIDEHGGTDQSFADFLGVSRQSVAKWRTGEALPDGKNCILIKERCKINIDELLIETKIKKKHHSAREEQAEYTARKHQDPEINNLLDAAERVLTSKTVYAGALKENIIAFDRAVGVEHGETFEHPPGLPQKRAGGGK